MLAWAGAQGALTLVILATTGVYTRRRLVLSLLADGGHVIRASTLAAMVLLTAQMSFGTLDPARQVVRGWIFISAFLIAARMGVNWGQIRARRTGSGQRRVLIVGAGEIGQLVAARLMEEPKFGRLPVGFLDKEPLAPGSGGVELPVLGASWDLERVTEGHDIDEVLISFSRAPNHVLLDVIRRCERLGISVTLVPRLFEKVPRRVHVEHLGGLPLLEMEAANPHGMRFRAKHLADRVVVVMTLPVVAPLMAAVALAVWLSSGRPIFFRQMRVGRDGREFEMLKFRTMDAATGEAAAQFVPFDGMAPGGVEGVDRRTKLGTFLRRTSIDELPQLINVLRGEMSLVGPRPERPDFVRTFNHTVHAYGERHRVKSGITGWAQVNGLRGKTSIRSRAEWDNYYIENWSLWLDLRILLATVRAVLSFRRVQ
jgi:exopolysaccharide biosynthesis polyprenyl glycosylphosphotransferase